MSKRLSAMQLIAVAGWCRAEARGHAPLPFFGPGAAAVLQFSVRRLASGSRTMIARLSRAAWIVEKYCRQQPEILRELTANRASKK